MSYYGDPVSFASLNWACLLIMVTMFSCFLGTAIFSVHVLKQDPFWVFERFADFLEENRSKIKGIIFGYFFAKIVIYVATWLEYFSTH